MSKTFLFQAIQLSQTVPIKPIQFSISIDFVYTDKCENSSISNNPIKRKYSFNVKTVLFQAIQFSINMQFQYKIVLFQANQFSISMLFSLWPIDRTLCFHFGLEWTWERCQWRGVPHSLKLQHSWNLTIRLFSVIFRTLVGGGVLTPLQRYCQYILQPQPTAQVETFDFMWR